MKTLVLLRMLFFFPFIGIAVPDVIISFTDVTYNIPHFHIQVYSISLLAVVLTYVAQYVIKTRSKHDTERPVSEQPFTQY